MASCLGLNLGLFGLPLIRSEGQTVFMTVGNGQDTRLDQANFLSL